MLRLLDPHDEPPMRLTTTGLLVSIMLLVAVIVAPVAWRSAVRAAEEPRAVKTAESKSPVGEVKENQTDQPAKPESPKPVSMSAEEFGRLSAAEQRALLVRVFQRRLEHSKNLYYETEQRLQYLENIGGKLQPKYGESRGGAGTGNWGIRSGLTANS